MGKRGKRTIQEMTRTVVLLGLKICLWEIEQDGIFFVSVSFFVYLPVFAGDANLLVNLIDYYLFHPQGF